MTALIVSGTDTGIGKTLVSAVLVKALGAQYWKPVQAGLDEETDSEVVARLSGQPVLREAYRLDMPASPHIAARAEGRVIQPADLAIPAHEGPLVVEGAGGVMVPLAQDFVFLDLFVAWQCPLVLVASTRLGTINHSLLSLRVLHEAGVGVAGIVFSGDSAPEVEQTILDLGQVRRLGRVPRLHSVTRETVAEVAQGFDRAALEACLGR